MPRRFLSALQAALLAFALSGAAAAAPPLSPLPFARQEHGVSLQEAVRRIEARTDGRVLAARTVQRPGGDFYLIRVLVDKGRVRVFKVDAATGEVD